MLEPAADVAHDEFVPAPARRAATIEEFLAIPEDRRFHELLGGQIVEKASPSGEHGCAQSSVVGAILPPYQRRVGGPGGPGGWWIATEVEVLLASGELVRPDVLGWRRDTTAERPTGFPVHVRPDWVCEIVSPSNANADTVKKLRLYHQARIGHYWIVDPRDTTLTVMRWAEPGYLAVLRAERGETVRPEPFAQIALPVGSLFGDETE